ncbi:hypothetical protein KY315_02335, partial [Candidatus Woesearchaeota archaeon]|nr:hypothetical protein [Candidatus Woesearchaeota archaeon]
KEELYSGPYLDEAPDLIIDQAKGIHIKGNIWLNNKIFEKPQHWKGENKKLGLFIAYGPEIQEGKAISAVQILDLAPTILHIFGLAVPSDMDGTALVSLFNKDEEIAQKSVKIHKIINEKSDIKSFTDKIRI